MVLDLVRNSEIPTKYIQTKKSFLLWIISSEFFSIVHTQPFNLCFTFLNYMKIHYAVKTSQRYEISLPLKNLFFFLP